MQKTRFMQIRYLIFTVLLIVSLFITQLSLAQVISGRIVTEQNEPIPYSTVFVQEAKVGTISNQDGYFHVQLNQGQYHITIRSLGFIQVDKEVKLATDTLFLDIVMQQQEFTLKEIKVFPGEEDPAYFIIRKAITKAQYYRNKIKHYNADLYIKSNFSFTNIPRVIKNQEVEDGRKFSDIFKENVTYVIESQNKITFDYPDRYDQKVISKKSSLTNFDEPPVMGLMTSSFYEERPNQVISPLSTIALKHYDFQYEGFITIGNYDVFKIRVTPKRKSDELVEGYIYIVDRLWCIYNLDFSSSFEFFNYRIQQQFENLGNENWLPVSHSIDGDFGALGLRGIFYYGASVRYDSIVDNYFSEQQLKEIVVDENKDTIVQREPGEKEKALRMEVEQISAKEELTNSDVKKVARLNRKILKEQYKDSTIIAASEFGNYNIDESKDTVLQEIAWDTLRAIPLTPEEIRSYEIADSLMAMDIIETDSITGEKKKKGKSVLSKILFGYYDLCKDSLIRLGYDGLLATDNFDFNAVDGYKYRQRFTFRYNPDSARNIYITPYLGYAFAREVFYGSVDFRFRNILWYGNQFGFEAGKLSSDFKSGEIGIAPALNSISTWFFAENYMKLYESEFYRFNFSQQLKKDLTFNSRFEYNHFFPLENNTSYRLSDKKEYEPNVPKGFTIESPELLEQKSFSYSVGLNYRKRQFRPWMQSSPFLFIDNFYEFDINFRQGVKNIFSSVSDFSQVEFRFRQQANVSPGAGIEWQVNAGYFFNAGQMHFSQFKHFRTTEIPVSISAFTHSFQLLNDYEFSTNREYLNLGAEYRSEYLLMRYVSFLNKRTWSESIHLNYLTTPGLKNYWEAGYSLNSLFFVGNIGVFAGFEGSRYENIMVKFSITGLD